MIQQRMGGTEAAKNVYCIDLSGFICAKMIYPPKNKRHIGDILRLPDNTAFLSHANVCFI